MNMNIKFTGNKNVDLLIMNKIENDNDLISLCSINKYANELCNIDSFWKKRIIKKYGKYLNYINQYNIKNWKEYYIWLNTNIQADIGTVFYNALLQNRIDIIKILLDTKPDQIKSWLSSKTHKVNLVLSDDKEHRVNILGDALINYNLDDAKLLEFTDITVLLNNLFDLGYKVDRIEYLKKKIILT